MNDPAYKLVELSATSDTSLEEAVEKVVGQAHKTIQNLCWFQVVEKRGDIDDEKQGGWQVTIKVGSLVEH